MAHHRVGEARDALVEHQIGKLRCGHALRLRALHSQEARKVPGCGGEERPDASLGKRVRRIGERHEEAKLVTLDVRPHRRVWIGLQHDRESSRRLDVVRPRGWERQGWMHCRRDQFRSRQPTQGKDRHLGQRRGKRGAWRRQREGDCGPRSGDLDPAECGRERRGACIGGEREPHGGNDIGNRDRCAIGPLHVRWQHDFVDEPVRAHPVGRCEIRCRIPVLVEFEE